LTLARDLELELIRGRIFDPNSAYPDISKADGAILLEEIEDLQATKAWLETRVKELSAVRRNQND